VINVDGRYDELEEREDTSSEILDVREIQDDADFPCWNWDVVSSANLNSQERW
jgi:hypothetical protein